MYNYDHSINNLNISNREDKSENRLKEKNNMLELMNKKYKSKKLRLIEMKIFNSNINNLIDINNIKNHDKIEAIKCKLGTNLNKTSINNQVLAKDCKKIQNLTNNIEKEDSILSKPNNNENATKKFKVDMIDYIINKLFNKKRESLDLFIRFRDNLQKYLDVENIIIKLNDIHKLKFILLDERQIKVFEALQYLSLDEMIGEKS